MSIKTYIQKYIIIKIESGVYAKHKKIPSENELATFFGCSRLTARNALQQLVQTGMLESKKGVGYVVAENNHRLISWSKEHEVKKTKLIIVEDITEEIRGYLNVGNNKVIAFIKEYYSKDKKMIAAQLTVLNKTIIWDNNYEAFRYSITEELIRQGILINSSNDLIEFKEPISHLKNYVEELGYSSLPLVECIETISQSGWVEKTVRITNKKEFKLFSSRQKFF